MGGSNPALQVSSLDRMILPPVCLSRWPWAPRFAGDMSPRPGGQRWRPQGPCTSLPGEQGYLHSRQEQGKKFPGSRVLRHGQGKEILARFRREGEGSRAATRCSVGLGLCPAAMQAPGGSSLCCGLRSLPRARHPEGAALGCPVYPGWVLVCVVPSRRGCGGLGCRGSGVVTGCAGVSHARSRAESPAERCQRRAGSFLRPTSR